MDSNEEIKEICFEAVTKFNEENPSAPDLERELSTNLFGSESELDSLGLVNFLLCVEELITEQYDLNITIADEKSMSRENSPFRTLETLVDYVEELVEAGST